MSSTVKKCLNVSLCDVDSRLRVTANMKSILRALDKCFSLPANYPKGNGVEFKHWLEKYHECVPLYPVQRSTGARNDMILEGAAAVYINGWLYKLFLDEQLSTPRADNILQENLFIVLSSVELLASSRVFAIIHFAINVPMRWLAGNSKDLAAYDWSVVSMSRAIDCVYNALLVIKEDGKRLTDENFMMSIFDSLNIEPLNDFMKTAFESEVPAAEDQDVNANARRRDRNVYLPKKANAKYVRHELFHPSRKEHVQTNTMMDDLSVAAAESLIDEFVDPKKLTSDHLESLSGRLSWGFTTDEHHESMKGKEATNDNSESPFALLTMQMQMYNTVGINNSSALALARHNGDFYRKESALITKAFQGQRNEEGSVKFDKDDGSFIRFPKEMSQSILETAINLSAEVKHGEQEALKRQREKKRKKVESLTRSRFAQATVDLANKIFYREMYDTRKRCRTAEEVDESKYPLPFDM